MVEAAGKSCPVERPCTHETLEAIFARCQHELMGLLYQMVGNLEDARDAYQDTFLKCWRNRDQIPSVQNLKAWVFRIALNTGRDMRQTAWRRHRRDLPEDASDIAGHADMSNQAMETAEQLALVRAALSRLRVEEREVFLLRQNAEMTYEEIAEALGIPSGTVKTRMRLALTHLRTALAGRERS